MRLVSLAALCLGAFTAGTFAQQQPVSDFEVKCLRFPPAILGISTFTPEAITGLSNQFANNTFDPPLPSEGVKLSPGTATRVGFSGNGGYQVCLQNPWFFKTQTITLDTISQAVAMIADQCCDESPLVGNSKIPGSGGRQGSCQDSKVLAPAVSGDKIKVVGQDYGDVCCGLFAC